MFDVQCMSNFISVSDICENHVVYCIPYYQYCLIIPYKSNSTPLIFLFFFGGGGPLFSFDNFLCNFCRSKCWFIGGFWRVRKGSKMSYRLNFNLWYYMYPKTSILTIHFYFNSLFLLFKALIKFHFS